MVPMIIEVAKRCLEASDRRLLQWDLCVFFFNCRCECVQGNERRSYRCGSKIKGERFSGRTALGRLVLIKTLLNTKIICGGGTMSNPNCVFHRCLVYRLLPKLAHALRRFGKDMASAMKSLGSLPVEHDPVKTIEDFVRRGTRPVICATWGFFCQGFYSSLFVTCVLGSVYCAGAA
jgi:hypothetical protein